MGFLGDIGSFIMTPLYYAVSVVLVGWHKVWSLVFPSGSGAAWARTRVLATSKCVPQRGQTIGSRLRS